jgi:cyanophycinase-like exopeptidase
VSLAHPQEFSRQQYIPEFSQFASDLYILIDNTPQIQQIGHYTLAASTSELVDGVNFVGAYVDRLLDVNSTSGTAEAIFCVVQAHHRLHAVIGMPYQPCFAYEVEAVRRVRIVGLVGRLL